MKALMGFFDRLEIDAKGNADTHDEISRGVITHARNGNGNQIGILIGENMDQWFGKDIAGNEEDDA